MVKKGIIEDIADLYQLSIEDILGLEKYARKSASKLYEAIQNSKKPQLDRFLYALGIRHIGEHMALVLARNLKSFEAVRSATREELESIPEVGPEVAKSVEEFFKEGKNRKVIKRAFDAGLEIRKETQDAGDTPLKGKTFVFTGSLEKYRRSDAERIVESLGGSASSSVSGNTDFLVVGKEPGSKLDDAKKASVRILNEEKFEKLVSH
jgi:DNA ligase (NAD+)